MVYKFPGVCLVATRKVLKAILNIANFIFKNVIMLKLLVHVYLMKMLK